MSRKHPDQDVRPGLAMAGRDIESGDLARAAARVSNALVLAPVLPEVHEMLARLAAHPRGGRGLFPLTSPLALATTRKPADFDALIEGCRAQPSGTHARDHAERVLQSTVMKTASHTATLHGSPRDVLAQVRRFTRSRPD